MTASFANSRTAMKSWAYLLIVAAIPAGCSKPEVSLPAAGNAVSAVESPDEACEVVYLGKSAGLYMPLPPGPDRGFLVRELFRQALLISARDELGLVTRDAWLGDAIPNDGLIRPFDLATRPGPAPQLEVLRGFPSSVKAIDTAELPSITSPDHYLKRLWVDAEKLSRTRLVEILKKALGQRQPPPWNPDLAPPDTIEDSLREMSFLAQFSAARQIHDLTATQGQSPALLGALARAYANLGILTEFHWHPAHKVFKARAILYAQRWLAREPDSLPAKWHRAYALALVGDHAEALDDLESAQKAWEAMADKQRPPCPAWVALLDAYCRYDIDKLAAERDNRQHGQLAALLHYHAVEMAGNQRWPLQVATTTLEKIPECYRVHDGVCNFGGVSVGHVATLAPGQVLARTLYDRVQQMPGLPESVRAPAKRPTPGPAVIADDVEDMRSEFEARVRLIAALRQASRRPAATAAEAKPEPKVAPGIAAQNGASAEPSSRPLDSGEPSWAALAQLIQEVSFIHVWRRAYFERQSLSVPAEDFLTFAAPLIADHPLRPFLETFAWDVVKQRQAMAQVAQLAPDGLELHAGRILSAFSRFRVMSANPIVQAMQQHRDALARDFVVLGRLIDDDPKQLDRCAKSLLRISPHSPLARSWLVDVDAASQAEIAEWEPSAVKYPALAGALARRHEKAEQWDDAVRCYQAAIKVVGDKAMYESLADLYEKKGEENRWLETLEAALQLPDYGLDHAAIQKKIAWHFMDKKEWTRALPYATAAADCYSEWGLLCAAACYEGLEEWEKAEQHLRATADRYRSSAVGWYFFCRRTGRGDLQAARDLAQAYVDDPSAQDNRNARYDVAAFYVLEKQFDKALAIYREAFAELADPFFGLWVAILAEELQDAKTRDAALARIRTDSPTVVRKEIGRVRKELIELAGLIERDLAQAGQGQIDLKAVDKLRATIQDSYELGYFDLFLARYLQTHGKRDDAIHYWKERIAASYALSYCRTQAGAALRELGLTPESSKTTPEKATPGDAKAAPEATKQGEKESDKERGPEGTKPSGTRAKPDA